MARLATSGFETGSLLGDGLLNAAGTPTVVAGAARTGGFGMRTTGLSVQAADIQFTSPGLGHGHYASFYIRLAAGTVTAATICIFRTAAGQVFPDVEMNTSRQLYQWDGSVQGAKTPALDSEWHLIELRCTPNTPSVNTGEFWFDGVQMSSTTNATAGAAPDRLRFGQIVASGQQCDFDDVRVNDDTGAAQTTFAGKGSVLILKAVSDNTVSAGMTGGAGGTTNLWDAVNNTPPVGVINASATNTSQIHDSANNATDNYDANVQSYNAAGIGPSDTITLVQAIGRGGNSTTTSTNFGVNNVSNPGAGTELTVATGTTATATDPTGWTTGKNLPTYAPSVTKTTQPVVRFGKRTSSTNVIQCDFLGLQVEFVPELRTPQQHRTSPAQRLVPPTGGTF